MGIGDKVSNKFDEAKGKAKETTGDATNNEQMQAEGTAEQSEASVKQGGEHIKDAAKDVTK
ncbi:MAG: CsbD family protein [Ornithinimicrobium sp.]